MTESLYLSHLEKQKTSGTKVLPIVIRKIKPFRLLVASLGSRGYFFLIWSLIVRGEKPGKITETKSRTSFQPNYLGRAIFFTNFLFSSFAWPGLSDWLYQKWMQWTRSLASCFDLNGFYACECGCFRSIISLLKSIGLKNQNRQNSNTFVALN